MKAIIIVSVDLPDPDDLSAVLVHMDPPNIPHFDNEVRVAIEDARQHVLDWLDALETS